MTDFGSFENGSKAEDLLRESEEEVDEGMADEIADMLADLQTTGEAEDDADVDLTLEEQMLIADAPTGAVTGSPKSKPVANPFQLPPTARRVSKEITATVNPFAQPPITDEPQLKPPALTERPDPFGAPREKPPTLSANPFGAPPEKPPKPSANPFAPSRIKIENAEGRRTEEIGALATQPPPAPDSFAPPSYSQFMAPPTASPLMATPAASPPATILEQPAGMVERTELDKVEVALSQAIAKQQQQQQQQELEQNKVEVALSQAMEINAQLTQQVAEQQQELEQTKAALTALQKENTTLQAVLQETKALHKNETRVLAAEVHRLRSNGSDEMSAADKVSELQMQHAEELQTLQEELLDERSRSATVEELTNAMSAELDSARRKVLEVNTASKEQSTLETTNAQLAKSLGEQQSVNHMHEVKIKALYQRLQAAETAASRLPTTESTTTKSTAPPATPATAAPPANKMSGDGYFLGPFAVNQEVEAKWKRQAEWLPARILAVNNDGSYRVVYEGRHVADGVPQSNIRSSEPPASVPPPPEDPTPLLSSGGLTVNRGAGLGHGKDGDPALLFPGHKVIDVTARRHPTRGFGLKFKLINGGETNQALYISEVADPSCGLKASDKLYSVDGHRANSFMGLKPLIADKTQIVLRVLRVAVVVQGVDLESLSTIELKKMLRERKLDTKCNRAAAIQRLTMSLDHETDDDMATIESPSQTKLRIVSIKARFLLSSRQSCLKTLMVHTNGMHSDWIMVDVSEMVVPNCAFDSPLINEVLARWTRDRDKLRRFRKWMQHIVEGRLSGEGFAWSIEILSLTLAAFAGFITKLVPLLQKLSPWASVSVCVRHSREFSKSAPMLLKPIEPEEQHDFTVDLRLCLNKFKEVDVSGLQAPKFALFGPGSEPIQMFLQSWTSDTQRIAKMNRWLKMTAEGRFLDPTYHKGIELQSVRKEIILAFLTLVVPLLRHRVAAKVVVSIRRARLMLRMAAAGKAEVLVPKMDLVQLLENVDISDAEFDLQIGAIV